MPQPKTGDAGATAHSRGRLYYYVYVLNSLLFATISGGRQARAEAQFLKSFPRPKGRGSHRASHVASDASIALRLAALYYTSYWSPRLRMKAGTSRSSCGKLLVTLLFTWSSDGGSRAGADGVRCRAGAKVFLAGTLTWLGGWPGLWLWTPASGVVRCG